MTRERVKSLGALAMLALLALLLAVLLWNGMEEGLEASTAIELAKEYASRTGSMDATRRLGSTSADYHWDVRRDVDGVFLVWATEEHWSQLDSPTTPSEAEGRCWEVDVSTSTVREIRGNPETEPEYGLQERDEEPARADRGYTEETARPDPTFPHGDFEGADDITIVPRQ